MQDKISYIPQKVELISLQFNLDIKIRKLKEKTVSDTPSATAISTHISAMQR